MDLIKEAISKAKAQSPKAADDAFNRVVSTPPPGPGAKAPAAWSAPDVELDSARLEDARVVSHATGDPGHVAFNLLRTRVYKTLTDRRWRRLAVTSPSPGCGKTMVSINLALSLARQPGCRTVLVDLDLKKSGVARTLGLSANGSIGDYLLGKASFEDCFVRVAENLVLGLNASHFRNASDIMHDPRLKDLLRDVEKKLAPNVVIFDLPPMLSTDEAIAFLPLVDASLLVVAAGATTAAEIEECERHLGEGSGYLGIVLNKSSESTEAYHYGDPKEG